jgi:hypothetical protein
MEGKLNVYQLNEDQLNEDQLNEDQSNKDKQQVFHNGAVGREQVNISSILQHSMEQRVAVSILLYDPFEKLCVIGVIEHLSTQSGRFKVGDDWFIVDDIERIVLQHEHAM